MDLWREQFIQHPNTNGTLGTKNWWFETRFKIPGLSTRSSVMGRSACNLYTPRFHDTFVYDSLFTKSTVFNSHDGFFEKIYKNKNQYLSTLIF